MRMGTSGCGAACDVGLVDRLATEWGVTGKRPVSDSRRRMSRPPRSRRRSTTALFLCAAAQCARISVHYSTHTQHPGRTARSVSAGCGSVRVFLDFVG